MQPVLPTTLTLGSAQSEAIYCLLMVVFFTLLAVALFVMLSRDTAFKREWSSAFGGRSFRLTKKHAALITVALWLLASGWFYNATLGERFYHIHRRQDKSGVVWDFGYEYPARIRTVPEDQIERWTGQVGWERRSFRKALYVELKGNRVLRSPGLHSLEFDEKSKVLDLWGIKVIPEGTNSSTSLLPEPTPPQGQH